MESSTQKTSKFFELPSTPLFALHLFVVQQTKLLLFKGATFQLPKCFVDQNESIESSIKRTLYEETGLQALEIHQGGWNEVELAGQHHLSLYAVVTQFEGEKKDGWEWFHYLELPQDLDPQIASFCCSEPFFRLIAKHSVAREIAYLASPYAHRDPQVRSERLARATQVAAEFLEKGIFVFSPLTHNVPIDQHSLDSGWDKWRAYDLNALLLCNKLILLKQPGWETSIGVRDELKFAEEHGIPIEEIEC